MPLASPNEKWMRVADIERRFCHFLLWRRYFCFDVVGNFELKKITPNCNALAKSIISYLWVSYYTFVFSWQCSTMLFTNKKTCSDVIGAYMLLRDTIKNDVEIGERQNRYHDGFIRILESLTAWGIFLRIVGQIWVFLRVYFLRWWSNT